MTGDISIVGVGCIVAPGSAAFELVMGRSDSTV